MDPEQSASQTKCSGSAASLPPGRVMPASSDVGVWTLDFLGRRQRDHGCQGGGVERLLDSLTTVDLPDHMVSCQIRDFIGSGGQGEVYRVVVRGVDRVQ